jgi:hypothetical protein
MVAYWIWTYPWGYFVGLGYLIARRIAIKHRPWWKPPTAYLFLLPFLHLAALLLVVLAAATFCDHGGHSSVCY